MFLGVLALAWIVVLVPPVLRARNDSKVRSDSIGDFQNRLGVLGRSHSARQARRAARSARQVSSPVPARATRRAAPMSTLAPLAPPTRLPRAVSARSPRASSPRPITGPVEPLRTRRAERSARRRREVVTVLFTATMLSAAVAGAMGGTTLWAIQFLADGLLILYFVGMLVFRNNSADRMGTVRYLPPVRPRSVPAYALRRTGSS